MKQTLIALATALGALAQMVFLGLNGLTLISVPMTIYLGLQVIEKTTEQEEQTKMQ